MARAHKRSSGAPTVQPGRRSAAIVEAAYSLIAEKGFEGLRTREVAGRVGINSATLHYYFPDKESLIRGVVEHLMAELQKTRAAVREGASPLEQLRAEFADIRIRLSESPDQLIVLTELAVRAARDPAIARLLRYLDEGWHAHLVSILQSGITEGVFRPDLAVDSTASLMMTSLRGLGYGGPMDSKRLDALVGQMATQLEQWVTKAGLGGSAVVRAG